MTLVIPASDWRIGAATPDAAACRIPTPLGAEDRAAGYWWEAVDAPSEISRTLVLDDPRRARNFFEALVADNIGIGRPEEVSLVFARRLRRPTRHPYQTRIFSTGTEVRIDFRYKAQPRQAVPQRRPCAYDRASRSELCHRLCAL